jgi:hypothetical protein
MTIADDIINMVTTMLQSSTWTSAGGFNPVENFIKQVRGETHPDFEEMIRQMIQEQITDEFKADPEASDEQVSILDRLEGEIGDNSSKAFDVGGKLFKLGPSEMTQVVNIAKNPQSAIGLVMKTAPMLAVLGPVIVSALAVPAVMKLVVELLTMPGGPFDKRLKVDFELRMNSFMSRIDQRRRQIGLDQVVITQFEGFGNMGGQLTVNTLTQVKATGISKIGLNERALGMTP